MSQSGAIRVVKGLKFGGYDHQNNELFYQGTLGTTKYIFDTEACQKFFGFKFGTVIEFVMDPTSPAPSSFDNSNDSSTPSLKQTTFKDFLGRYFMPIGVMISPATAETQQQQQNSEEGEKSEGGENAKPKNLLSLYAVDIHDLTIINLTEATDEHILHARYPNRLCSDHRDHGLFDVIPENFPFGFSSTTLYGKYFVKEGEHVYLANLQDSARIVGEAFGCVWVALESKKGKIVPLPKATDESRLVNLYGLSDIQNAPQPGSASYGQPAISPRQIQTPRANAGGPPFVLGKKTADGKSAVLCNCPMNQQVLAVCTLDALKPFEVKPMGRIFFALGVDAGKSATILGVRNGSLYIHVDGASKCICLRNATNAQELRERYTGTDAKNSVGAPTCHFISPAQTVPRKIDGPASPPATLDNNTNKSSTGSPLNGSIPRLSLGSLSFGRGGSNNNLAAGGTAGDSPSSRQRTPTHQSLDPQNQHQGAGRISPIAQRPTLSASSPLPKGFFYWTANGCLKFDISAEACSVFGVRHAQTHRFTSGPDAGQLFHIVGVHSGSLYVVQDHKQFAIPLRYCQDEKDVKSRVGPSLISTTKLRSADPRGAAPSSQPLRSPDRRAGSPFGLTPRNYQPEPGEDVGNWGKEMPPRQKSETEFGSFNYNNNNSSNAVTSERDVLLQQESSPSSVLFNRNAANNNNNSNLMSGTYEQQHSVASRSLNISKSMSPSALSQQQNNLSVNQHQPSPQQQVMMSSEFSVSIGRQNREKNAQSMSSHPLGTTAANSTSGPLAAASTDRTSSVGGESTAAATSTQQNPHHDSIVRNTRIQPPRPVRHEAFKVGNMPSTRMYLKAIALRALGVKREQEMPTAFFRFFSHDAGQNLSRALKELPKFQNYWEQRERPMRGGRSFQEATTDMMVEALENLAQLKGGF